MNEGWDGTALRWCHAGCTLIETTAAIGLTPADLFRMAAGKWNCSHRQSIHPFGLDILLRLPKGAERSFIVTSALGRFVPSTGGRERVRRQEHIAAVIVETRHRQAAINVLGVSAPRFSMDTVKWQEWGVAHKCSTRLLTILVRDSADCPLCRSSLTGELSTSNSSPTGEQATPDSSPTGELSRHEPATTRPRFFKELEVAQVSWENRYPEGDGARDRSMR